jgi:mannitol-1-phosphate 5-dehydrogenase
MAGKRDKRFAGFGFGPIQSALFLYEAFRSGNFSAFTVADVDGELVRAVRSAGGRYTVNIARLDGIERFTVEGMELHDSRTAEGRAAIVRAVAAADELATALPSVAFYTAGGESSVADLLAAGLAARRAGGRAAGPEPGARAPGGQPEGAKPAIVYTAENHNHAAEILEEHLRGRVPADALAGVQVLNTVIGKMSGVITDPPTIRRLGLATLTPSMPRAVLVEQFNRILISRVRLPGFRRGIEVFQEKEDLLPFEEAKLYGHNAIHALIAYLAELKGWPTIAAAGQDPWIMEVARRAFIQESGAALIHRHTGLSDPLFTPEGYLEYADDLLARMVNPHLNDLVERVGRDHSRKLGIEDRLYGTMALALEAGIEPVNLALGAAAGVVSMIRRRAAPDGVAGERELDEARLGDLLRALWGEAARRPGQRAPVARLVGLTAAALQRLRAEGLAAG